MGRIKSALVKRTAFKLMKDAEGFSGEFDNDKKMLGNTMPSKKLRNKILKYKYGQTKIDSEGFLFVGGGNGFFVRRSGGIYHSGV